MTYSTTNSQTRSWLLWVNENFEWEKRELKWTTMPGTLGKYGVLDPIEVEGVKGVAVIKEGQYINCYEFRDNYTEFLGYPFFKQVGTVTLFRDGDEDLVLDYDSIQQKGWWYGLFLHIMSNLNVESDFVNSAFVVWSMGCQRRT